MVMIAFPLAAKSIENGLLVQLLKFVSHIFRIDAKKVFLGASVALLPVVHPRLVRTNRRGGHKKSFKALPLFFNFAFTCG
jgi:hypothetical protein